MVPSTAGSRLALAAVALLILVGAGVWALDPPGDGPVPSPGSELVVYRTPACGCCAAWARHMAEAGFTVRVEERTDLVALKRELGVPSSLYSCHTAVVGGRVIEGHVPAPVVRRYLAAGAPGRGLSVPGMPAGSPGMHGGGRHAYDVFVFDGKGRVDVFAER